MKKVTEHIYNNPFVYCLILLALLKSGTIQMDLTPYGDGRRIMVWLAYLQEAADGFSQWLPYRNGGMPLFSDPEQFWALMPFIDTTSEYSNLQLNILLFMYCIFPFFPAWFIARRLGIKPFWAGLAAVFVSFNGYMIITEQSARFATFVNFTTLMTILAILLRPQRSLRNYIIITLLVGACLAVAFQYAIVHILLIYSFLLFSEPIERKNKLAHFLRVSFITGIIGVAAVLLAMVLILPVFGHLLETTAAQGQFFYLPNLKNGLESFGGLIVPFTPNGDAVFISLLTVPGVIAALIFGMHENIKSLLRKLILPLVFCLLFFLMALPLIGSPLSNIYAQIPIVSTIRQLSYALGVLSLFLPFFAFGIFSSIQHKNIMELGNIPRILCASYFAGCAILAIVFGMGKQQLVSDIAVITASVLLLVIALFWAMPNVLKRQVNIASTFGVHGILLSFISILFLFPSAFYERHPNRPELKIHVTNERKFETFSNLISKDATQYSKILTSGSGSQLGFMYSKHRTLSGFSTYMPDSFPYVMSLLNPSINWATQRPHWVKRVTCNEYDETALELMHIDYLICVKRKISKSMPKGFEVIESHKRFALLKRIATSSQALRIYCRSRSTQNNNPDMVRDEILASYAKAELLIPDTVNTVQEDSNCPKNGFAEASVTMKKDRPDEMIFEVVSKHSGTLVIPDNFNSGWHAEVNNSSQRLIPAFFALRGVEVNAGESIVRLKYQDRYFELGLLISSVTMTVLCLIWFISFMFDFKRRKQV